MQTSKPASRILLLSTLIAKGACSKQVELFRQMFGDSVEVTEQLAISVADKFYFGWAAHNLLSDTARAKYFRVEGAAWAEYRRVEDAASVEYDRVKGAAWAEYRRVSGAAWAEYKRVRAPAFARLYIGDTQ